VLVTHDPSGLGIAPGKGEVEARSGGLRLMKFARFLSAQGADAGDDNIANVRRSNFGLGGRPAPAGFLLERRCDLGRVNVRLISVNAVTWSLHFSE
jgi:hypothetical protein